MIPLKLSLKNFMCYGINTPPLDFRGFHVACLCGDNGNGKSALLDAITWAIWGKARAKSDDDLIHLGRADMEVDFEFALGPEHYRVIRKRSRPRLKGAGQSMLDLQIASGEGFRSIAGNSIPETNRKIKETLRMDYETFINSAYLQQGRADEFSKKPPSQRKQVLANVLDLSRYDELEELARSHARSSEGQQAALEAELKTIDEQLAHRPEYDKQAVEIRNAVVELDRESKRLADEVNRLRRAKDELDLRRGQLSDIDLRIKQANSTALSFEARAREHRTRIDRYEKVLATYEEEMARIETRRRELAALEEKLREKRELAQQGSNRLHLVTSTKSRLVEEGKELDRKIEMLAQGDATCPLCGSELGVEGRERILARYQAEINEKREAYKANEQQAKKLDDERRGLIREVETLEKTAREERAGCERREEVLKKERSEAEASLPQEKEALREAEEAAAKWRATAADETKRSESLRAELAALPGLESSLRVAQKALDDVTARQGNARKLLGAMEENLRRCADLERSRVDRKAELDRILKERSVYEELAAAFSKKGIQALIIENALPELEEEANRLLARMTDNRMHLKIETQREKKTKRDEAIETLDINIADELGTRSYEMYSGGEAFRIDFALRIALSKLLARRAGAPLSTLIVDEGFGTQDAGGREKLVEAINSIQDDFDKILVITHIEELKDAFPARIEITKTAEGSMIEVS